MTTTMFLFEELPELVNVADAVLSGAYTYLARVIAINETLLGELDEVDTVIGT